MADNSLRPEELAATSLFASVPVEALRVLAEHGQVERHRKDSVIFDFGDPPGGMYLVRRGRVEVVVPPATDVINEIGPGGMFGEVSLILGEPRTARVRAKTAVTVWTLPRDEFAAVLDKHPELSVLLAREVSRRLAATTRLIAPKARTTLTAVWGDGSRVAAAMARAGATNVGWARLPGSAPGRSAGSVVAVGGGEATDADVATWLAIPVPGIDDLVVSVGRVPVARNRVILEAATNVVLLDSAPKWLAKLRLTGRVLGPDPGDGDLRRVGRVLAGRAIGLVLSSGGSKTVAHIGTITALFEHGVDVDFIAGSSGGSMFAAGLAFGHSPETMIEHTRSFAALTTLRRLDYAKLPRAGLIRGIRIHEQLRRWFDGAGIEDALIPLRVVASDVETGNEVVIDSGDVADALRASMSIPGAFEPWKVDGRWLIDGAIVDPLPAAPLRSAGAGFIVASNVAGQENLRQAVGGRTPGLLQIVGRVVNASERELLRNLEPLVDVMVRPVVKAAGPLDFTRIDEFIKAGKEAAHRTFAEAGIGRTRA